jgi:hypothetical protein
MATCPEGHESAAADYCDVCGIRIGPPAAATTGSGTSGAGGTGSRPDVGAAPSAPGSPCPRCGTAGLVRFCEACGYQVGSAPTPVTSPSTSPAAGPDPASASDSVSAPGPDPATASSLAAGSVPASASGSVSAPWPPPDLASSGLGAAAEGASSALAGVPSAAEFAGRSVSWTAVVSASRTYFDSVISERGPDADSVYYPAYCPERRYQLVGPQMRIGRRSVSRGISPEIDLTGPPTDPGISRLHAILLAQPDGSWMVTDPGSENGTLVNDAEVQTNVPMPLADGDRIYLGAWTAIEIVREPSRPDPGPPGQGSAQA